MRARLLGAAKNVVAPSSERVRYDHMTVDRGHVEVHYRGVKALRSPFDYVMYQMIISELKPDLIIELGTRYGGGALYLADLLNNIGNGVVHSVDIADESPQVVKDHPRIRLFHEGWEGYDLSLARGAERVLVIEDASHIYEQTLGSLQKFAPVVTPGSYLIVEDGIVDYLGRSREFNGGPCRAIREFLPTHPEYVVDRRWCDMFGKNATNNVNGYLKRVR